MIRSTFRQFLGELIVIGLMMIALLICITPLFLIAGVK